MAPVDLTAVAQGNSAARQAAGRAAVEGDPSGRLALFRDLAASAAFGTNVKLWKILACDAAGAIVDTRRAYIHVAGGDIDQGLAIFATAQGRFLGPRAAFEGLWDGGTTLVYGAVNAGGIGLETKMGEVCLLLEDPGGLRLEALAVFPGDSAQRYADATAVADAGRATAEATAWGDRGDLAVIERGVDARLAPKRNWPFVLCSDRRYLETVIAGQLPLAALTEVRLRTARRSELRKLRARWVNGDPRLTATQRNEVAAYDALTRWRRRHGTVISEVA